MIAERPADCGNLYQQERKELAALAGSLSPAQLQTIVPATPAWCVKDVVAHLVGIAADLNALRFGDGTPDEWSARQVSSRRDASVPELVAEWEQEAGRFEEGLRLLGYELGSHYVGDLLHHIQDIHEAIGIDPVPDDEALAVALDFYLDNFSQSLDAAAIGSVVVQVGDESWTCGAGPQIATLRGQRFDLFRSFGGRRTDAEIRELDWSGDADRVLPFVSAYAAPPT